MPQGRIVLKKQTIPYRLKKRIAERDDYTCQICGKIGEPYFGSAIEYKGYADWDCTIPNPVRFEIDHIIPESKGGLTVESNFQLACRGCNRSKGAKNDEN